MFIIARPEAWVKVHPSIHVKPLVTLYLALRSSFDEKINEMPKDLVMVLKRQLLLEY